MKKIMIGLMLLAAVFCGSLSATPALAEQKLKFMLDWYPNPDHIPMYVAEDKGFFKAEGLDVDIMVPADPNDPLKLTAAGQLDYAVSYQPNVTIARSSDLPVTSIGALVQHPLSTILFLQESGFKSPADFKGKRIGYSVEPLYRVLFEAVAEHAGLSKTDYELFRVGFNLTPPLLGGKVDAVIGAFRNYEAIQVELEGKKVGIFPLEEHGIPDFYELVIITHADKIKNDPAQVKAFMAALTRGIKFTMENPEESLKIFFKRHPNLKDDLNRRAFEVTLPFFKGSPQQDIDRWKTMQDFMLNRGLIKKASPLEDLVWLPK